MEPKKLCTAISQANTITPKNKPLEGCQTLNTYNINIYLKAHQNPTKYN